ncbi:DegT/DnrJ/EryC1/StrS family aminotransferase, partial [Aduncisulcus paluster]
AQGGDPLYAAWKLTHLEPYFSKELGTGPGLCPVAESIQPRLLQFKTNYYDFEEAKQQAEILHNVANYFNKG